MWMKSTVYVGGKDQGKSFVFGAKDPRDSDIIRPQFMKRGSHKLSTEQKQKLLNDTFISDRHFLFCKGKLEANEKTKIWDSNCLVLGFLCFLLSSSLSIFNRATFPLQY